MTDIARAREILERVKERCFLANGDENWQHDILSIVVPFLDDPEALSTVPEPMEGWRPIETAPKDGTHILLWDGNGVCEGRYVNDACRWFERNADPTDAWDGEIYRPTHWQPLPAPPNTED